MIFHRMHLPYLLIHSSVDGPLGYFHLLVLMNKTAMSMDVQLSVQDAAFNSYLGLCTKVELLDHVYSIFNSLRDCHTIFHKTMRYLQGSIERG